MNSGNLINPLSPQEQYAWKRWLSTTVLLIGSILVCILISTAFHYWNIYGLHKRIRVLQKNVNTSELKKNSVLIEQKKMVQQRLKEMKQLSRSHFYQDHLKALSNAVPQKVRLVSIDFEETQAFIKGQTHDLEFLLELIHNLEKTTLFQSMNLIEMQPSLISYEEKKLVNFTIHGKLK
jgi:Tfp pilus assembly protein PilN